MTVGRLFESNSSGPKNFPLLGTCSKLAVACMTFKFKSKCVKACFTSSFFISQSPSIGGSSWKVSPHSEDGRLSIPPKRPFGGLTSVSIAPSTLSTKYAIPYRVGFFVFPNFRGKYLEVPFRFEIQ